MAGSLVATSDFLEVFPSLSPFTTPPPISSGAQFCIPEDGVGICAVPYNGPSSTDFQVKGIVEAIHWLSRQSKPIRQLRYMVGNGPKTRTVVLPALGTILSAHGAEHEIVVEVDLEPQMTSLPDFSEVEDKLRDWRLIIEKRSALPEILHRISNDVGDSAFRWYRPLTGGKWSGRAEGLEVCTVDDRGQAVVNVGAERANDNLSAHRKRFLELAGETNGAWEGCLLDVISWSRGIELIKRVLQTRSVPGREDPFGCDEHFLESRILRGDQPVVASVGRLEPVVQNAPFQLPTLWSAASVEPRYLDVLMRSGSDPWAIELKVRKGGQGENYRLAVAQVVLYREFIRRARALHPWMAKLGLEASKCQAAVVIPRIRGPNAIALRSILEHVAGSFDVEVIELDLA